MVGLLSCLFKCLGLRVFLVKLFKFKFLRIKELFVVKFEFFFCRLLVVILCLILWDGVFIGGVIVNLSLKFEIWYGIGNFFRWIFCVS